MKSTKSRKAAKRTTAVDDDKTQGGAVRVVAVLEHPLNDSAQLFIVDVTKLDQSDPEQKKYYDAVLASVEYKRTPEPKVGTPQRKAYSALYDKTRVNGGFDFTDWKAARVYPPCHVDAVAEVWDDDTV